MKCTRRALTLIAPLCIGAALHPTSASADTPAATIVHGAPDRACENEQATLTWAPPDGVAGVTGYEVTQQITTGSTPQFVVSEVGLERSLSFTIPFGLSTFQVRARTAAGLGDPYTSASIMGNRTPSAMSWNTDSTASAVGDGSATVPFKWYGPSTWSTTGGVLPTTIKVTASTGTSVMSAATHPGVATTFSGLTNGTANTFSAVTSNSCGSSRPSSSPSYTPGLAPVWTQASPPLTVVRNKTYGYGFAASGDPAPTYELVNAPAWLTVNATGQVSGTPPKGTSSFSYSLIASNGVGIGSGILRTDATTDTFVVNVTRR